MYTKKNFDGCVFNPLVEGKMLEEYRKLSEIVSPEASQDAHIDSLLRYVIMLYDPKSPLVTGERDINFRKSLAAELSGFDMNQEDVLEGLYKYSYPHILELCTRYLTRFGKSKEWAAICAFEYKFWESIKKIMEPISGKTTKEELEAVQKKAAISEEIDKDIERLDKYYRNFFGGDDELERKAKKRLTPELIATKKKNPA